MSNIKHTKKKLKEMRKSGVTIERESTSELNGKQSINGFMYSDESTKHFEIEKNPFPFLFVDLTYRCNMACNVCYNPIRPVPDMSIEYFDDIISRLPHPIEIRMLGGEPTIHPDFYKFLESTFKHGHSAYISSNGKSIAKDVNIAHEIKRITNKYSGKLKWHMDMSGGKSEPGFAGENNKFYKLIHNEECYEEKILALKNLEKANIGRVTISGIIIRDLNEDIMPDLFSIAEDHKKIVREVAFRSQGKLGRFIGNAEPYLTNDWKRLMLKYELATVDDFGRVIMAGFMSEKCEGKNCCFHYKQNRKLAVSWLDFLCDTCWLRGQLNESTSKIEYMFENLQVNDFNKL